MKPRDDCARVLSLVTRLDRDEAADERRGSRRLERLHAYHAHEKRKSALELRKCGESALAVESSSDAATVVNSTSGALYVRGCQNGSPMSADS